MKIVSKPIEAISWSSKKGEIRPLRFKLEEQEGQITVIKVDRIIQIERSQRAGDHAFVFTCQSEFNGTERIYALRYSLLNCTWVLYKI
jgi:hypothetical protein